MAENESKTTSLGKRIAVLALTLGLAACGIYMWAADVGDQHTAILLGIGIALGLLYTVRGGTLPAFVHRLSQSHWVEGTGITTDDDPRNISPKVYLPILLGAILLAAGLYFWFVYLKH